MKQINSIQEFFNARTEIDETRHAMGQFIIDEIKKKFIGTIFKYDDYVFEVTKVISVCPSDSFNSNYGNAAEAHLMGVGYIFVDDGHTMRVDVEQYAFKHISFRISSDGIYTADNRETMTPEQCIRKMILHGASEKDIRDFEQKHV